MYKCVVAASTVMVFAIRQAVAIATALQTD
jgi:hypothetical protein